MRDLTEEEQIAAAQAVADVSDRIETPLEVALTPDAAEARAALPRHPEWGTFALILACYLVWGGALFGLAQVSHLLAVLLAGGMVALHSSLCHEVLHGHPFRSRRLNEALVVLPLNLAVPYGRFRDTHLQHHQDEDLTDPYDDPESNFHDPAVWARLPAWRQRLLRVNNTLLGRMVIGPVIGQISFMQEDWTLVRRGQRGILRDWGLHALGTALVLWIVSLSALPVLAYLCAAYLGLSVLKIRTYLEHRAHEDMHGRTAIVESRGLMGAVLGFLFLNNNLHIVHHLYPGVAWHQLPALYKRHQARFQARNDGYVLASYASVFRQFAVRAKDPVPHPLWKSPE
ncbi:fatty acid desaturase [Tritonibacter scottomollicae]|uniref:Fatty acid desaturase n=1 Tax=Tritonibacter scottomollicae TaxID=483013 RepID=A0ABZ0HL13_TRISK|nr:fatty acid desaturase [Tritonibacter scottomollicae]WOI35127.1 fatty acid desaturase [Tritonibacter scottomollicae]